MHWSCSLSNIVEVHQRPSTPNVNQELSIGLPCAFLGWVLGCFILFLGKPQGPPAPRFPRVATASHAAAAVQGGFGMKSSVRPISRRSSKLAETRTRAAEPMRCRRGGCVALGAPRGIRRTRSCALFDVLVCFFCGSRDIAAGGDHVQKEEQEMTCAVWGCPITCN